MKTLLFLIGASSAGKSTIANKIDIAKRGTIISFDSCIDKMFRREDTDTYTDIFNRYIKERDTNNFRCPLDDMVADAVSQKRDIVVDMVNDDIFHNDSKLLWIELAKSAGYNITVILLKPSLDVLISRNPKNVPIEVLKDMHEAIEEITPSRLQEIRVDTVITGMEDLV